MSEYRFVTVWRLPHPIERVWQALNAPEDYARWWPSMKSYRDLKPGVTGVGAMSERVVRGRLPYELRYVTTVTRSEPPRELAYDAVGDLIGEGRFVLASQGEGEGEGTEVTFYWNVRTAKSWMNVLAFLLKPLLSWNHNRVMADGEKGLQAWLNQPAVADH